MRSWFCTLLLSILPPGLWRRRIMSRLIKGILLCRPFSLLTVDSTIITRENLTSGKPVMVMYFNPGCDHCQHQMEDMIEHKDALKEVQIVMATYAPLDELIEFIGKYKLAEFPNIKVGRDTKYMLQPFFKIGGLPYQAFYEADAKLITTYEGNVKIDTMLNAFKKKD